MPLPFGYYTFLATCFGAAFWPFADISLTLDIFWGEATCSSLMWWLFHELMLLPFWVLHVLSNLFWCSLILLFRCIFRKVRRITFNLTFRGRFIFKVTHIPKKVSVPLLQCRTCIHPIMTTYDSYLCLV